MQADSLIVARSVDFLEVHHLVAPILATVESWPAAGTLTWQRLADTDPSKWAAVLDLARYGALHLQLRQEAFAESAKDIAAAENWGQLARRVLGRNGPHYIERRSA